MNYYELNELLASAAPVTDAEVALWDLSDDDLCAEVMSTRAPLLTQASRRRLVVVAAAAALVAGIAVSVTVGGSAVPSAAATADAALRRSSVVLDDSGRAELRHRLMLAEDSGDFVDETEEHWEYSGEDSSVTFPSGGGFPNGVNSFVDGEFYYFDIAAERWFHDLDGEPFSEGLKVSPRSLLGELDALDFEEVGNDQVDGVDTVRLRATNPEATPLLPGIYDENSDSQVTALELWIDDEDLVQRIELAVEGVGRTETISVRFFDFGAPITIEPPTDYEDIDLIG